MNILVVGAEEVQEEFNEKFSHEHKYTFIPVESLTETFVLENDMIIDFQIDNHPEHITVYGNKEEKLVFVNAVKIQLAELEYHFGEIRCKLFGFNGLPTFINREQFEVSLLNKEDKAALDYACKELDTEYALVNDRVGLVTPRVICMIINEACFTLQEGTASVADIDRGMKLAWGALARLVFLKRSNERMALFTSLMFVVFAAAT